MLVACRLAGLSALEGHYAGLNARAQFEPTQRPRNKPMRQRRTVGLSNVQSFGAERLSMQVGGAGKGLKFPDLGSRRHVRKLLYVQHCQSQRFSPRILTAPLAKLG